MDLPKPTKTRSEAIKEAHQKGEPLAKILLLGMYGSISRLPEYNDADQIYRDAEDDIRSMHFENMGEYIDSLVQLVDHWKELAEHYLNCVNPEEYEMDENGYLDLIE